MKRLYFMSNLQAHYHFKHAFHKVNQHTWGKWLIHGTNDIMSKTKICTYSMVNILYILYISFAYLDLASLVWDTLRHNK